MKIGTMVAAALGLVAFSTALYADRPPIENSGTWGQKAKIGTLYNKNSCETVEGTVISFQQLSPKLSRWNAVVVFLKTAEESHLEVHLGPQWFLEENRIALQPNDQVQVTGSRLTVDGRKILVASRIAQGNQTLQLRRENGKPLWANRTPSPRFKLAETGTNAT